MTWIRGFGSLTAALACALLLPPAPAVLAQQPPSAPRFDITPPPPPLQPGGPPGVQPYRPGGTGQAIPASEPAAGSAPLRRLPPADGPGASPAARRDALAPSDAAALNTSARVAQSPAPAPSPPVEPPPQPPPAELFEPGQILAWVGNQPIQSGDIMPTIELLLAPALAKMSPEEIEVHRDQIEEQKQQLLRQALNRELETKLLYLDFLRSLPADKKNEILPNITKRAEAQFYEKQLPESLERANVESTIEWEGVLRKYGSSVAEQRRLFVERILGQSVLGQRIDYRPEVTHQEMLDHYWANIQQFERPARARWEKLSVRFDRFSSRAEAWAALAAMGNEVLRGAPLAAVARRHSQDVDASNGGYHDWTTEGSLASDALDRAIFTLPVAKLSERLEDNRGFHIVRVIEREEAGRVPFLEAQVDIRETIRKEKTRQQILDYVAKLRSEITVWTVFDEEPATQTAANPAGGDSAWPSTPHRR